MHVTQPTVPSAKEMAASCMLENGRRAPTQRQVENSRENLSAFREKHAAEFAAKKAQKAAEKANQEGS